MKPSVRTLLGLALALPGPFAMAQSHEPPVSPPHEESAPAATPMTGARLVELIKRIDPEPQNQGNVWQFALRERPILLIYDEDAGRMRMLSPIAKTEILDASLMQRLLQANYDSALDARYAIANDMVWSAFIHPLASLSEDDFASGVAQVYTAAETFGTTFTSGALVFGGGDSNEENRKLMEYLNKQLKPEI